MKWLTNIYDPSLPNAKQVISTRFGETQEEAWEAQQRWLHGKVIGDPQASESYTVEQMRAVGLVGVYTPD